MLDELPTDFRLPIASEEYAVGQDDRAFALAFERRKEMQEKSIVAIPGGGNAERKASKFVVLRIQTVGPGLGGEGRIGHREIEGLEASIYVLEVRIRHCIAAQQHGGGVAVQNQVHPGQGPGGVVHLLAVDGDLAWSLRSGLE